MAGGWSAGIGVRETGQLKKNLPSGEGIQFLESMGPLADSLLALPRHTPTLSYLGHKVSLPLLPSLDSY